MKKTFQNKNELYKITNFMLYISNVVKLLSTKHSNCSDDFDFFSSRLCLVWIYVLERDPHDLFLFIY